MALALSVLILAAPVYAEALPQLPHAFYGSVTINGAPAPDGTQISATVSSGTVITNSQNPVATAGDSYGISSLYLLVQGDIPDGATITFYVNGVSTGQTATFESGGGPTEEDLSVNITVTPSPTASLTPTPTPTSTVTPSATPTPTSSASPTPTNTPTGSYGNGTVAASGGIVNTSDGTITITFPADAFNASTNVSIQGGTCQHADTADFVVGGTCFNVTPDGELNASATICVNLSAYDFSIVENKADLTLGYWANGSWNVADNVTISGTTICGKTAHLSDWAVLGTAVNTMPTPSTSPTPSASPTPTITSQPTATPSPTKGGGTNWALIGGIVGGVLLLVAIVIAISIRVRSGKGAKRNHKPKQRTGNKLKKSTDDWQDW